MLPYRGGGPGGRADDRQGHRRAQPAERLGQRAAHRRRSSARSGCWSASPTMAARCSAPGRVKHPGLGMTYLGELDGRRPTALEARSPRFSRGRASRRRCPTRSSTRSGRSSRSTPARCRPPALLHFMSHELVAFDGTKALMAASSRRSWRSPRRKASRSTMTSAGRPSPACWRRRSAARPRCCRTSRRSGRPRSRSSTAPSSMPAAASTSPTPHNETMVWMIQAAERHYLQAKA